MIDKELQKLIRKNKDLIDDYLGSVMGLYAFAESACWDEEKRTRRLNSKYSVPHTFSDGEKELTPDSAIQITNDYGIIAEMKKHFNEEKVDNFNQLMKYDTDLIGWWTKERKINNHDLVLLCHEISGVNAEDAYKSWIADGNGFKKNFSIVEFHYLDTSHKQNFFLRRRDVGKLSDSIHDEHLRKGKVIPPKVVIEVLSKYKFYDADPPLLHTLLLIYNSIIPLFIKQEEFEELVEKRKKTIEVGVEQIRDKLQEQFMPEDCKLKLPKLSWVIEALDFLVEIELALKLEGRKYSITVKTPPRKDLHEYLLGKLLSKQKSKKKETAKSQTQQELFDDLE